MPHRSNLPSPAAAGPTCSVNVDNGSCNPDPVVHCNGNVALGCPTGKIETFDCANLLESFGTCQEILGVPWDLGSYCHVPGASCNAGCLADGGLRGCLRGHPIDVACGTYGLKACAEGTILGTASYHCAP